MPKIELGEEARKTDEALGKLASRSPEYEAAMEKNRRAVEKAKRETRVEPRHLFRRTTL